MTAEELDPLIHVPARLRIVATLAALPDGDSLSFTRLQDMIGRGGGGQQHFHAHFHGPADAPAVSRWFRDNMRQNAGAIRDMFRQNALTPRSL